jgi:hypothetical protein
VRKKILDKRDKTTFPDTVHQKAKINTGKKERHVATILLFSVLWVATVLRIRDVYPGFELFLSRIQGQKDSGSRIRIKEL